MGVRFHAPITPWPALTRLGLLLAILAPAPVAHEGVELPKGFLHEELTHELDQPVAMAFAADGRLYVAEKAGRVWPIVDHAKAPLPLIDLSEEITNYESHGLKGFALHPDFLVNGHYFVLYEVDRHHLDHFGTPSYDPLHVARALRPMSRGDMGSRSQAADAYSSARTSRTACPSSRCTSPGLSCSGRTAPCSSPRATATTPRARGCRL